MTMPTFLDSRLPLAPPMDSPEGQRAFVIGILDEVLDMLEEDFMEDDLNRYKSNYVLQQ